MKVEARQLVRASFVEVFKRYRRFFWSNKKASLFWEEEGWKEEDDDNERLKISDQPFSLDALDVHNIEEPKLDLLPDLLIDDIEVLE